MDATVKGLGLRVRPSGAAAFYLRTTDSRSKNVKVLLGSTANLTVAEARVAAQQKIGEVRLGDLATRAAARARNQRTLGDLLGEYVEAAEAKGRSTGYVEGLRAQGRNHLSDLMETPLLDIEPRTLEAKVHRLGRGQPAAGNKLRALLIGCGNLAVRRGYLPGNPASGIERAHEEPRRRVLTDEEVGRLLATLDRLGSLTAKALALILLTTSRPAEVLKARWDHIDLEAGVWVKPAASTKTRRLHTVALSSEALAVLHGLREVAPEGDVWVFPSTSKTGHIVEIKTTWRAACRLADISGAVPYDLRRTSATRMLENGVDLATVMRAGNWSTPQVLLRVYAQPDLEVQRRASEGLFKRGVDGP